MNSYILYRKVKLIAVGLSILLLSQSCKSFYANALSLDVAVKRGKSARVIYDKDKSTALNFEKVVKLDTTYYGMNRARGKWVKTPIQLEKDNDTYKNPSTFGLIMGSILVVGLIYGIEKVGLGDFIFPEEEN